MIEHEKSTKQQSKTRKKLISMRFDPDLLRKIDDNLHFTDHKTRTAFIEIACEMYFKDSISCSKKVKVGHPMLCELSK